LVRPHPGGERLVFEVVALFKFKWDGVVVLTHGKNKAFFAPFGNHLVESLSRCGHFEQTSTTAKHRTVNLSHNI